MLENIINFTTEPTFNSLLGILTLFISIVILILSAIGLKHTISVDRKTSKKERIAKAFKLVKEAYIFHFPDDGSRESHKNIIKSSTDEQIESSVEERLRWAVQRVKTNQKLSGMEHGHMLTWLKKLSKLYEKYKKDIDSNYKIPKDLSFD